ncbi:MAG: hypothetical protein GY735_02845, partial [Delftia sp.]|nr:hypothetical protein [Delftia sp.]
MPFINNKFKYLYIEKTHRSSQLPYNLRALQTVLDNPHTDAQVHAALNKLTVTEAKKYKDAIQYLVSYKPNLEYVGLEYYHAAYEGVTRTGQITDDREYLRYKSKILRATAKIFSITPCSVAYDRGFIQLCTSINCKNTYTDDLLDTRYEIPGTFPISDSSSINHIPWYYVGVGNNCTYPTAHRRLPLLPTETYEFTDNISDEIPIMLHYTKSNTNKITFIEEVTCREMFYVWFAYRRTASLPYRILTAMTYGFDFTIAPGYQLTFPKVKITPY